MEFLVILIFSLPEGFTRELRSMHRNLNSIAWNVLLFDMATLYQVILDDILDEYGRQEEANSMR